jgi:DNA-binding response OmpR family regulator
MIDTAPIVLIAEHDNLAREFLTENLQADGYRPVCAADGDAALELIASPLDAPIVDVNGDTLSVIDVVRGEAVPAADPQLPILVLTSNGTELHRTRLFERGADDVVCKPSPTISGSGSTALRTTSPASRSTALQRSLGSSA